LRVPAHYLFVVILRVLLAESGTEDTLFLRNVLADLEGARCWSDWVHLETSHAATCADTTAMLSTGSVDILLLDLDLQDSQGADTFRRVQAACPHIPVILLIEPSATSLAERLVRDGAQDFLLKKEVDCAPLARAMRNAQERHRLLAATRATSMTDQLTGLLTRPAFLTLVDRDRRLAERFSRRMMILIAELAALDGDAQRRDLALVETADWLRSLAGPAALVARLNFARFGLAVFDTEAEPMDHIRARVHMTASVNKIALGSAVFDPQRPVSLDALLDQAARKLRPASRHASAAFI
jgi:DNA-binding NarL/FixJ family response regulator